jgi:formylglycine-generating enzyme
MLLSPFCACRDTGVLAAHLTDDIVLEILRVLREELRMQSRLLSGPLAILMLAVVSCSSGSSGSIDAKTGDALDGAVRVIDGTVMPGSDGRTLEVGNTVDTSSTTDAEAPDRPVATYDVAAVDLSAPSLDLRDGAASQTDRPVDSSGLEKDAGWDGGSDARLDAMVNPEVQAGLWGTDAGSSCVGAGSSCQGESCCTNILMPGGPLLMGNSQQEYSSYHPEEGPEHGVVVSSFALDKYEVTVGRFRQFVQSYTGTPPAEGAGANPSIPGSGWSSQTSAPLPATQEALRASLKCNPSYQTWTDTLGTHENYPINCVDWNVAFAFCIWDGGRLPTEAEWEYAAAGGEENRIYPWGGNASSGDAESWRVNHTSPLTPVGSYYASVGRWGHLDLSGSIDEWTLDLYSRLFYQDRDKVDGFNPLNPMTAGASATARGGSWSHDFFSMRAASRGATSVAYAGIRCARDGWKNCLPGTVLKQAATPTAEPQCSPCPAGQTSIGLDATSCRVHPQIAAGYDHTCLIKPQGGVVCWGNSDEGQTKSRPGQYASVAASRTFSCGLTTAGFVKCWGCDKWNSCVSDLTPLPSFVAMGADSRVCGIRPDGTLMCFGNLANTMWDSVPAGRFTEIAVGGEQACAIRTDGTISCWGVPGKVAEPPSGTFIAIAAGGPHVCAIRSDLSVACWGNPPLAPVTGQFVSVTVGKNKHACGIGTDGKVKCWTSDSSVVDPPADSFTSIAAGYAHTCGIKSDGQVACWGDNKYGQSTPPK